MTFERSHGKPRLTLPRLRDVAAGVAAGERTRDRDALGRFAPGNAAGRNRTAKRSLTATLRAAAVVALAEVAPGSSSPQAGAQIAQHALTLFRAGARELSTDSTLACSHLVRWAVNTALAAHLSAAAVEAGADTERGQQLIERAHACETRAERGSIAALTMARALAGKAPNAPRPPWLEGEDRE